MKILFLQKIHIICQQAPARTTAKSSLQIESYILHFLQKMKLSIYPGCSGDKERLINFILNERTRELNGEWNRWEELTKT